MKKRAFTLIEVTIALGLLSLLLGFFAFWNHHCSHQKKEIREMTCDSNQVRYFYQCLSKIFSTASLPFFKGDHENLIFYFDRGVSRNPRLSGDVLGHLYLDRHGNLTLGIWPKLQENKAIAFPTDKMILMAQVSQVNFSFYYPSDPTKLAVSPEEVGKKHPNEGWQGSWLRRFESLPALVKISVTGYNGSTSEYIFDLKMPIRYPKDNA